MAYGKCKDCLYCRTHQGQSFRQFALENDFKSKTSGEIDHFVKQNKTLICCKHAPKSNSDYQYAEFAYLDPYSVVVCNCGCGEFARATNSNDPIPKK